MTVIELSDSVHLVLARQPVRVTRSWLRSMLLLTVRPRTNANASKPFSHLFESAGQLSEFSL